MEKTTTPQGKKKKENPHSIKIPQNTLWRRRRRKFLFFFQGSFLSYHSVSVHARSDVGPNLAGKVAAI
jgi:hypothetical protein